MARINLRRKRSTAATAPPPPPPGTPAAPGQASARPTATEAGAPRATAGANPASGAAPAAGAAAPVTGAAPAAGAAAATGARRMGTSGSPSTVPPRPTLEGLRAWLATLDRKVGLRTYLGIAAVILAIATSAVAIVLAIDARDNSADNDDLNAISERVNELESGSTAQFDASAFEARLTAIEDQLAGTGGSGNTAERLSVLEDDIEELRGQISQLEGGSNP